MSSNIRKSISKLEKELASLKVDINNMKPRRIKYCKNYEQLEKFTIVELKKWLKTNRININNIKYNL